MLYWYTLVQYRANGHAWCCRTLYNQQCWDHNSWYTHGTFKLPAEFYLNFAIHTTYISINLTSVNHDGGLWSQHGCDGWPSVIVMRVWSTAGRNCVIVIVANTWWLLECDDHAIVIITYLQQLDECDNYVIATVVGVRLLCKCDNHVSATVRWMWQLRECNEPPQSLHCPHDWPIVAGPQRQDQDSASAWPRAALPIGWCNFTSAY